MELLTEIEEIQKLSFNVLLMIVTFCNENNINYFLAFGTLLGAVRHKGFIPWDDDVDIWMKRNDYNKFVTTFPDWGEKYGLYMNTPEKTKNYNRVFSQICLKNTILKFSDRSDNFSEGLYIDIFPIDGCPNNSYTRFFLLTYLQIIKNIGNLHAKYKSLRIPKIGKSLLTICFSKVDIQKIMKKYNDKSSLYSCEKSDYLQIIYNKKKGRNIILPSSLFKSTIKIEFESITANIPCGYNKILSLLYGDYNKYPPLEERIPQHNYELYITNEQK